MRGLPPPPPNVFRVVQSFTHAEAQSSVGYWLLLPELELAPLADVQLWLADFAALCITLATAVSTTNTTTDVFRLESFGLSPYTLTLPVFNFPGAWSGSTPNNCATGLYLFTGERGKMGRALVRIPGFPNEFTDDELTLNDHGWVVTEAALESFLPAVNALARGALLSTTAGTVHRQRAGVPMGASVFAPFVGSRPVERIARISRRLYR